MNWGRVLLACALGVFLTLLLVSLASSIVTAESHGGVVLVAENCFGIPNCFTMIQDAVKAANNGDTILVSEGVYLGTVVVTKPISLSGGWNADFSVQDPAAFITEINAQRLGPGVHIIGVIYASLKGFAITEGDNSSGGGRGGGLSVETTQMVTVVNNVIFGNVACDNISCQGYGGGIGVFNSSAYISNNIIIENLAATLNGVDGNGGGVFIDGTGHTTVIANQIVSNTASVSGDGRGGGAYIGATANLSRNSIRQNSASKNGEGRGGGIYAEDTFSLSNNSIIENRARTGGGLFLSDLGTGHTIEYNLIARNAAPLAANPASDGGGGITSEAHHAKIAHNLIVSNTAGNFGGGMLLIGTQDDQVYQNTIKENAAGFGGGVFFFSANSAFHNNEIVGNLAITRGGGVYIYAGSSPEVDGNRILSNTVIGGEGGGICVRNNDVPVTLTNQLVAHNAALSNGGGLYAFRATAVHLVNNTFVDNDRASGKEGIALLADSRFTVTNNIIVGHSVGITVDTDSEAILDYNGFFDNGEHIVGTTRGTHSRGDNPQFAQRDQGDFHLLLTSPLIDQGDSSVVVPYDLERDLRPIGVGIDIGADEAPIAFFADESGASFAYTNTPGFDTTLIVPPNAVSATTTILYTPKSSSGVSAVPKGLAVAQTVYELGLYQNGVPLAQLAKAMTISIAHRDNDVSDVIESTLAAYRSADSGWERIGTVQGESYVLTSDYNVISTVLLSAGWIAHFGVPVNSRVALPLVLSDARQ